MTVFDALLILLVGVSIFFATVRGAVREMATLAALGVAGLSAWAAAKPVAAILGKGDSFLASAIVAAIVAAGVFVGGYFLLHRLMLRMKLSARMREIDRLGGGAFGLIRALALIGLGFLGYGYYLDDANQPDAVRKALLLPVATSAAGFFQQFAPATNDLSGDARRKAADAAADGYDNGDRTGLREIVTTVTTTDGAATTDPIADILSEGATNDGEPQGR